MPNRILTILAMLAVASATRAVAQPAWQFEDVGKLVAVADVHGAYGAFERVLVRAGVIDETGAWLAGASDLVIVGDVLDRGDESRRALDLIMRLETEAASAGGRLHFVLGNHEVMNLTGDLRYVSPGEYAAFAPDESLEMREAAFRRYAAARADSAGGDALRAEFDTAFPPGFFAHRAAFAPDGEYGAWLLGKPMLLVIDDVAFVHGGLANLAASYGPRLNATLGAQLSDYVAALAELTAAGLLDPTDGFYDHAAKLDAAGAAARNASPEIASAVAKLLDLQSADLFSPDGPIWYRGNVGCNRLTEQDRLRAALAGIGAARLVVGHTPNTDGFVLSRMDQTLLRIDTGMLNSYYGGRASALVIEAGRLTAYYEDETSASAPLEQPRRVGIRPRGLSTTDLEALLAHAEVSGSESLAGGASLLDLAGDGLGLQALFMPSESAGLATAVAAYRLDRLLGLDMVPVTIVREVDGVAGSLQYWPPQSLDENARSEQQLGGSAWCPLADQFGDMLVFDRLIYNEARTIDRIRYSVDNFELLLVGNDRTFSTARGAPAYLAAAEIRLTPAWRAALASLDEASLTEALGDVLDRRRIRALLQRRDALLESP